VVGYLPHRRFARAPAGGLVPVPDAVSDDDATWFALAGVAQAGVRRAEQPLGARVVVVGLGLLGQLVVQYMRLLGARQVIAIDPAPARLEMAQRHGATTVLGIPVGESRDLVLALTSGQLADVVYDMTGHPDVFQAALPLVRRFGTLALIGDPGMPGEQRLTGDVLTRNLRIVGSHGANPPPDSTDWTPWSRHEMATLFFDYLARGDLRVTDMITHRFPPAAAAEAYAMLCRDRSAAMGVLFEWS
jgi:threonine dehydrogenase-like Zn-dependent dehydrogenase